MLAHAVVVGASEGIGLATAQHLLAAGVRVTCLARRVCPLDGVQSIVTDVALYDSRIEAMRQLGELDIPIDTLVYAAGTSLCAPVETTTDADYRYLWEVNYFGFAHLVAGLLPALRAAKGRIVAVGSMAAVAPIPFDAHYSAAKNALVAFCHALAAEVAPHGVKVSVALPGGTKTNFTYKRKVYDPADCGCYAHAAQNAGARLACIEQNGMAADRVARWITALLALSDPPLVAPIGMGNCALYGLCRSLPSNLVSGLTQTLYTTDRTDGPH